jgi:predicted Zn-dependent peptidase
MIINAGTRDEEEHEHGIAHFIEHVIFKGTSRRKTYHILSRLDDVGGELDAFTTKENTVISASFLNEYYERSVELISDILFNSTFPEKELDREKEVILDEINSYKDSPAELVFDDFEELLFKGHPIARNTLGSKKSIRKFNKEDILNFIQKNYDTSEMVFCSVGKIKFEKLVRLFDKYFEHIPANTRSSKRNPFNGYKVFRELINKKTYQSHCIIGNLAYNAYDENQIALVVLNNLIGGPTLNSRFNLELREKKGFVYNIESNYTAYSDVGLVNIYFGTDKENLDKCIDAIYKELDKIKKNKLGVIQLERAKKQIHGQIAISADINSNLLFSIGKSYQMYGKVDDLKTVARKINDVTSSQILEIANEVFEEKQLSTLIYK